MTDAEVRQELLDGIGEAVDELGTALAALGTAYELLDERSADRLEEELFGPVQKAYGRAKRTYADFAARHRLRRARVRAAVLLVGLARRAPVPGSRRRGGRRERARSSWSCRTRAGPSSTATPSCAPASPSVRELVSNVRASARMFTRTLGR